MAYRTLSERVQFSSEASTSSRELPLPLLAGITITAALLLGWQGVAAALAWLGVAGLLVGAFTDQLGVWIEALGVFARETGRLGMALLALAAWVAGLWWVVVR